MTPEQLKASILQYAIQGKLVEQRAEEGTAEKLYQQIQAEKQRLIEEKKIKKEKPLADIPDNEIPFEIPESWKWVNIAEMSIFQEGPGILAKDFRAFGVPLIRIAGMQGDILSLEGCNYLDEVMVENKWNHFRLDLGDILISTSASMDKICEVDEQTVGAIPYTGQIRFKMLGGVSKEYFKWFIKSPCYMKQIDNQKTGGMIKHYGPSHLRKMFVPLPPLSEQKRIVAKIEELLPLVDRYAASYEKLEQFNAKFPEDMKKSILKYAIQGKLVEQRPEEGTGEELYQQIQAEKQRLIAEKKIKKEKPLAEISEDEIPFEIPESWKWVRIPEIGTSSLGKTLNKSIDAGKEVNYLCSINVYWEGINLDQVKTAKFSTVDMEKYLLQRGDLLVCEGGDVGRSAVWDSDTEMYYQNALHCVRFFGGINPYFFRYCFELYKWNKILENASKGMTIKHLVQGSLHSILFPFPPLVEQKRIVAKIEELLPLCERLK